MGSHDAQANAPEVGEAPPHPPAGVFPVTHSLPAPGALLAEVARAYPINRPVDCALVRSYVNDVYAIAAATSRYILKVYRAGWRSRSEIDYELDVLAHLTAKGVAVAPALPRRDGQRIGVLRAPEGDRYAVLFQYAEGAKPAPPFTATLYYPFGQAT